MPKKTAAVFDIKDIPAQSRGKPRGKLKLDDLHPSQKSQAQNADVTAIKEDKVITILSPVGNVAEAAQAVQEALANLT